jgi:hypothetical protein
VEVFVPASTQGWEELIASFLFYDTDRIDNDAPNKSYIAGVFVAAATFFTYQLPGKEGCGDTHADTQTDGRDL